MSTEETSFSAYNVTGCYPDMEGARAGVEALEEAGVAGSRISLLGQAAEEAAEVSDTRQRDEQTIREGMKSTIGGAAAGTGVGAAVGFIAGAVAFGIPGIGPAVAAGIWATTLGGAVAGGGVGFTAGAMARMKQSEAWELTLADVREGRVIVGAHTDDPEEFARASEALEQTGPDTLRFFDRGGANLDPDQVA
jgi:hypothetical protein